MASNLPEDVPRQFAPPATEPAFLPDPLIDQLLQTVIALSAELWIERDRRMTLESVLVERGILPADAVEDYRHTDAEHAARRAARIALVERTLGGLKDLPGSAPKGD